MNKTSLLSRFNIIFFVLLWIISSKLKPEDRALTANDDGALMPLEFVEEMVVQHRITLENIGRVG